MALKIPFIVFFVFVAGFSVLITQASALRCYKETKIAGNDWPGYENGEVDCPDGDDRCAILTYELDSIPMSLRFCLNSTECDDGCGLAEDIAEKQQLGTVSGCDETCCVGDLCNAPEKKKDQARPGKNKKFKKFLADLTSALNSKKH